MFHCSQRLVSLPVLILSLLTVPASALGSEDREITIRSAPSDAVPSGSYPLTAIDRPGILPTYGTLLTLEGKTANPGAGATFGLSLGLGLGRDWEATAMVSASPTALEEAGIGIGRLICLAGPVELDARFAMPIYRRAPAFQDFELGPAFSYTHHSRWVIAGLANLVHVTFAPESHLELPIDVSFGWQPWSRLFLWGATRLANVGIHRARTTTMLSESPLEGGVLFAYDRDWDFGVVAMNGDVQTLAGEWSVSLLATRKTVR